MEQTTAPGTAEEASGRAHPRADPSELLRGRDMLCFSHDWTGDPLSKTHLMRLLARDNRVLWVNSIGCRTPSVRSGHDLRRAFKKLAAVTERVKEVEPNIFVLNPLAVPFYGPRAQRLNRWLLKTQIRMAMRKLGFSEPVNWVFNPAAGVVARQLGEQLLIYYCVDEYTAFAGVPTESLVAIERRLLQQSDLVVVSAERLLRSKSQVNPGAVLVRHGVDFEHFRKALDPKTEVPAEIRDLPRPIIGYFGLIAEDWVDVPLMERVARSFPDASVVMLGKSTMDLAALQKLPNVHLLGRKPYDALPNYCKAFDVALIPFPISEVTLNANPLKAREYLAAGLPVVSSAIPEVEILHECLIGRDHEDFVRQIREALKAPGPEAARSERMRREGWGARLDEVRGHLARAQAGSNGGRG